MKFSRALITGMKASLALGILGISSTLHGAPVKTPPVTNTTTNKIPAEVVIPQAIFDLSAPGIKDPFFPSSLRSPIPVLTNSAANVSAASFSLKALSGSASQRLALINNRTLARGEDAEVTTLGGNKVKIVCVDIRESSALIRVANNPEPIELFLRKGVQ